jgi:hypothetical protein
VDSYREVVFGLVTSFVAFLLGYAWERGIRVLVNLRARRFWRPLMAGQLSVVLGRFRDLPGFEASGVVGAGDNLALRDLSDYFGRIGFKRFTVFYNDQFDGPDSSAESPLRGNLVLLGGPDANSVTREVLSRVHLGVEFLEVSRDLLTAVRADGRLPLAAPADARTAAWWRRRPAAGWRIPVVLDREHGRVHGPVLVGEEIRTDCGVVIRCPNPFNPAREVVIICGSYGYGTWGAVRYIQTADFLRALPAGSRAVECLLSVEVTHDMPQGVHVEVLRGSAAAVLPRPATVPRVIR